MKVAQRCNAMHWKSNISHRKHKVNVEKFEKVKEMIGGIEADAAKFYNRKNVAAVTSLRKVMQDLKVLASDLRKEVTEKKNAK